MRTYFTRIASPAALVLLLGAAVASSSCTSQVLQGESNSYLIIDRLSATAGGSEEDEDETTLQSDVFTNESIFEDVGSVILRLAMKDPGSPTVPNVMTSNNFVTIDRYRVSYSRTDGRNQQGIDVPFSFEGAFTVTVRAEGTTDASFVLVRPAAKAEAPLRALRNGGIITMIAEVTFFGRDQTGRAVSVSGRIQVDFANWGDPD